MEWKYAIPHIAQEHGSDREAKSVEDAIRYITTNHRHLPYDDTDGTHRLKMPTPISGEIVGAPHMLRACRAQRTHTAKRSCSLCIDRKG